MIELDSRANGRTTQLGSTEWRAQLLALERENDQLREALSSRIVIEQAKGILAERFSLDPGRAFELLRRAARSSRQRIHALAAEVVTKSETPPAIEGVAVIPQFVRATAKTAPDTRAVR